MHPEQADQASRALLARYAIAAPVFLGLLWIFARILLAGPLWQVVLALVLCALPVAVTSLYHATVQVLIRRQRFQSRGLLFHLFSSRVLALLVAIVFAFLCAVLILIRLHTFMPVQWLLLALTALLHGLVLAFLLRRLAGEYKAFALHSAALRICAVVVPLLPALAFWWLPGLSAQADASLAQHIAARRAAVADLDGSVALQQLALVIQTWEGFREYTLGTVSGDWPVLVAVAAFAEQWLLYFLLCTLLTGVTLSRGEWRRCLGPLSEAARPAPLSAGRLAVISAVTGFVLLFMLLPFSAYTELWVKQREPRVVHVQEQLVLELEQIGDGWYRPGTTQSLQSLRREAMASLEIDARRLRASLAGAFDAMEGNVDIFLDWYYSLAGEYTRIARLMTGELENYLAAKLTETLQQGDSFAGAQALLATALQRQADVQDAYSEASRALLAENRVRAEDARIAPLSRLSLDEALAPPVHEDFMQLQTRLVASTAGGSTAGLMSSVVAAKLSSRLLAKGGLKVAAKALTKLVAGKAGGAALGSGGGAAAGAAVGSVVPGLGTAVGAVIGGLAGGIVAGITIDKALLELEEALSRDAFRQELLTTIRDTEQELLSELAP